MRRWLYHASFVTPSREHSVATAFDFDQKSPGGPGLRLVVGLCSASSLVQVEARVTLPPFADGSCSIAAVTCPRSLPCVALSCLALRLHIHNWHPSLPLLLPASLPFPVHSGWNHQVILTPPHHKLSHYPLPFLRPVSQFLARLVFPLQLPLVHSISPTSFPCSAPSTFLSLLSPLNNHLHRSTSFTWSNLVSLSTADAAGDTYRPVSTTHSSCSFPFPRSLSAGLFQSASTIISPICHGRDAPLLLLFLHKHREGIVSCLSSCLGLFTFVPRFVASIN
ncbi:hypothetical protein QBC32DRAFT_159932 [Pseudoneurospora amorphoporcata]|uniref:Uncharacterized protein n=1 Tax=Pseudoneurospora amorphoporcata TaxID=241081 RepID=A0AAN6NTI3_9PEZI|nr:hypothetical protein QBC32DRAFT_159932 [Pseudoneurospora amorphoporcata]